MNQTLINNWNSVVKNSDRVFMLGDFCLAGVDKTIEIGNQLNGRKTLIMGNHDHGSLKKYYKAGFEMVSKYPILLNDIFLLSHYPLSIGDSNSFINIYGHVHNHSDYKDYTFNSFCASAERINYTPISLDSIKQKINSI